MFKRGFAVLCLSVAMAGCAGMKVIDPNEPDNKGTLALDMSGGSPKLVATYTCKLKSMGNRFSAVAKTEEEARKEVIAQCKDRTLLSVCEPDKVECAKN
ncbi:hypothetical protein QJS83_11375 [Bdellovibrio sp. 22V]|uniref:hypothetical protein n=1 Tax=Bdellovibrio TaxID=958 RepID=UPI002542C9F3|nr:hypothetical protein [Bdellovibrio sp. 22V]WII71062.1 hypothetical protein QJS83_11375 [Bdellovibrio sp. 22V]